MRRAHGASGSRRTIQPSKEDGDVVRRGCVLREDAVEDDHAFVTPELDVDIRARVWSQADEALVLRVLLVGSDLDWGAVRRGRVEGGYTHCTPDWEW